MLCFSVSVNGSPHCIAGIGEPGDLHFDVVWVLRRSAVDLSGRPGSSDEGLTLSVSGQVNASHEVLSWPDRILTQGDEIVLKIIDAPAPDSPAKRAIIDEEALQQSRRDLFERLKKVFEPGS